MMQFKSTGQSSSRPRHITAVVCLLLLSVLAPRPGLAQGNLSTQGLGYPQGQLSTRALSAGGALGESDPTSAINPAALTGFATTTLYFQLEPEFRTVDFGSGTEKTTTARYPLMVAAIPFRERWVAGISTSTLLDRSWETTTPAQQVTGNDTVNSVLTYRSVGAITDVRLALGYSARPWLRFGLGGHLFTGSDEVSLASATSDTSQFGSFGDTSTISFSGRAVSAGMQLIAPELVNVSLSYRYGGRLRATRADTLLASGRAPDRLGLAVAYIGIQGSTIAVRTAYERWSNMSGLVSQSQKPRDTWDTSIGADVSGPRLGSTLILLRAGGRWRSLPFSAAGNRVTERSLSLGAGTFFAGGRVSGDFALVRSQRSAGLPASESAWTLSAGVTVRP